MRCFFGLHSWLYYKNNGFWTIRDFRLCVKCEKFQLSYFDNKYFNVVHDSHPSTLQELQQMKFNKEFDKYVR